jgi:hypothetical protein
MRRVPRQSVAHASAGKSGAKALRLSKTRQRAFVSQSESAPDARAKRWVEIEQLREGIEWMTNDDEMKAVQPMTDLVPRSPAAERMQRHRKRKRQGLRCVTVQLRETEIDVLIRDGLLAADARNDPYAVRKAVHKHFDRTLRSIP